MSKVKHKILIKKVAICAVLTAFAIISFIIESLFPPLLIPGARMGISNIFILLAIILLGQNFGIITVIVKILLGSFFTGNISSIIYSLPAGVICCIIESVFILRVRRFSLISVSVFGATINNLIQNATFCLATKTFEYFIYLPYLSLIGIGSGLIIGLTVYLIIKRLPFNGYIVHTNLNNLEDEN